MKKYNIHPDFKKYSFYIPFNKAIIYLSRIPQKLMWIFTRIPENVSLEKVKVTIEDKKIKLYIFAPKERLEEFPCLLYFHGGAFAYKAAFHHKNLAAIYARDAGCKVILPDYSLMPRNSYPKIQQQTLKIYKYILKKCKELKINKDKIVVGGDSAGGFLTLDLIHQLNQIDIVQPCAQMLIYPVVFTATETNSLRNYIDTPRWDSIRNKKMWNYYLHKISQDEISKNYLEKRDFTYLKLNTYLEVAEFDPLHDEGIIYAEKLKEQGLLVQVEEPESTIHGYDMNLESSIVKDVIQKRIKFLKENFREKK